LGNAPSALSQLKELVISKKIPSVFLRRDPNLRFIFGVTVLQELVQDVSGLIETSDIL
jgi:hypothetical protein